MSSDRWIVVRNWDRFQHRDTARGDVPVWIKLYTRLLSDEEFLDLTPTRQALLLKLWLEYARTRRKLPEDTASLSRRLSQRVTSRDLDSLSRAGFIEVSAGIPPADVQQDSSLEVEVEVEDPLTPATSAGDFQQNGPATTPCLVCGEPVLPGYRCPNCNANPRTAGSSTRQRAKRLTTASGFERAVSYVRNEGWQYDLDAFRRDLDRFELVPADREQLERMRDALIDDDEALNW